MWFLVAWLGLATAWGQTAFNGKLVATALPRGNFYYALTPGTGYALQVLPAAGQQYLRELRLPLRPFERRDTAQVPVRVRLAPASPDGTPADEDLLPVPMIISTLALQQLTYQGLVLTWPPGQVAVPGTGFFVVLEGLSATPDEYVAGLVRSRQLGGMAYQLARRQQPAAAPRLLSHQSVALLQSGKATAHADAFWLRGDLKPGWHLAQPGSYVPLLKLGLE